MWAYSKSKQETKGPDVRVDHFSDRLGVHENNQEVISGLGVHENKQDVISARCTREPTGSYNSCTFRMVLHFKKRPELDTRCLLTESKKALLIQEKK